MSFAYQEDESVPWAMKFDQGPEDPALWPETRNEAGAPDALISSEKNQLRPPNAGKRPGTPRRP